MSRPVGRHRARRDTGIRALRRPAVATTAAISAVSVSAAGYSTASSALAGSASVGLQLSGRVDGASSAGAVNSAVLANGQTEAVVDKARDELVSHATQAAVVQSQSRTANSVVKRQEAVDVATKAKQTAVSKMSSTSAKVPAISRSSSRPRVPYSGNPQKIAASMLNFYNWSQGQMGCLVSLWNRESGWRITASNVSSGAYGIPQSLPANKMASAGSDWQNNPVTQIRWGLDYIQASYGSPCGAWGHSQATGWY